MLRQIPRHFKLMPWPWRKPTDIGATRAVIGSQLCSEWWQFGAPVWIKLRTPMSLKYQCNVRTGLPPRKVGFPRLSSLGGCPLCRRRSASLKRSSRSDDLFSTVSLSGHFFSPPSAQKPYLRDDHFSGGRPLSAGLETMSGFSILFGLARNFPIEEAPGAVGLRQQSGPPFDRRLGGQH